MPRAPYPFGWLGRTMNWITTELVRCCLCLYLSCPDVCYKFVTKSYSSLSRVAHMRDSLNFLPRIDRVQTSLCSLFLLIPETQITLSYICLRNTTWSQKEVLSSILP
ncbi:hypothetical protein PIB30_054176 [Stylosanthes scabra]|uniref:Secreted protein n=1 Tax=Stylosanthes scabra TaxID=79078 RepID=A0ABU6VH87_9FABA|nr:hypothetical protein [Stylosanthes scabra]